MTKITISNRKVDPDEISKNILIKDVNNGLDDLCDSYNSLVLENLAKSDNLIQEKYITITAFKRTLKKQEPSSLESR